jgi:ABC-type sulfate/molybdate transport systems ATPase subunit
MLALAHLSHAYGATPALHDCSLTLLSQQRMAIVGPSGCGKSTLLRIIAGLEPAHHGRIWYHGHDITQLAAHRRQIGLMFQDHALFPHLTVQQNIAYGIAHQPRDVQQQRVHDLLEMTRLTTLAQRYPDQLSGGERQRVALARSLAPSPRVLLLDEPFAALDRLLRDFLLDEVVEILTREEVSAVYVTHDANEACRFADQLVVMRAGRIVAQAAPVELYRNPPSVFVAQLLGMRGIVPYQATATGVHTAFGSWPLPAPATRGTLLIRPEASLGAGEPLSHMIRGVVRASTFRPPWQRLVIAAHDDASVQIDCDVPVTPSWRIGASVTIPFTLTACTFLHDETSGVSA